MFSNFSRLDYHLPYEVSANFIVGLFTLTDFDRISCFRKNVQTRILRKKKRMEFCILYAKKFFDNMKFATICLEHTDTRSENNHIQSGQIIKYASFNIIAVKLSNKN